VSALAQKRTYGYSARTIAEKRWEEISPPGKIAALDLGAQIKRTITTLIGAFKMVYDWEKQVISRMYKFMDILPDHLQIVGVAIENVDTGEGALIESNSLSAEFSDVTEADVRKDILGDAKQQYERAYRAIFIEPKMKGNKHGR
jgi:hypothetical protein